MDLQDELVEMVDVERWPTERPLFFLVLISSIVLWVLFTISIIGIIYAGMLGLFFFVSHVVFITHLRGSAIRLGPEQMPDLYDRVEYLSQRIGLDKTPAVYVMQAGGALNALATKLFSANFIVLFSDLLEACGENTEARDMIIAHELGHLKAGHLRGLWFLLPGLIVPFIGSAYSQAREYTSDRYGFAACNDKKLALIGLGILAAGGEQGPKVNLRSFANQGNDLNTTWMTLGRWLSSHPPLVDRIVAVEPTLITNRETRSRGTIGAIALILCFAVVPAVAAVGFGQKIMANVKQAKATPEVVAQIDQDERRQLTPKEIVMSSQQARKDMVVLSTVIEEYRVKTGEFPMNSDALLAAWKLLHPETKLPVDPFDGYNYGYEIYDGSYVIWSEGPSAENHEDDLVFRPGQ
ncbi:MAG: M48 family metallopeptidase [Desulfobulbaceae bacterium]|nr:M48 family metallopeptidase [Desulfobulbaceae bacterium]